MPGRRAAVLALVLAWGTACGQAGPDGPPGLLLVTVDTLRADRLGLYGYARPTSPHLDALAREATVFETAIATCASTAPAVASLLTGSHRATHRVFGNGWTLPEEVETLAETLRGQGYETAARVANTIVDASLGFAQGFDDFAVPAGLVRTGPGMLAGAPLVAEVEAILARVGQKPFFLWVHLMDPHGPYFPPPAYRERFPAADYGWADDADLPLATSNFGLGIIPAYQAVEGRTAPADYRARYDAEIAFVDDHVGAILQALDRHRLAARTLVVVTADHGESLGEHDYYFQHGWFLYDDAVRVPLVIRGAGVPAGRRVAATVSTIDLAPTLLDLLGLPRGGPMEGTSLRPLLEGDGADREAFAQTYYGEGMVALRAGRHKYVFKPPRVPAGPRPGSDPPLADAAIEQLFDLAADPAERENRVAAEPAVAGTMRARVQAWLDEQARRGRGKSAERRGGSSPLRVLNDPQLERQLRALGYLD